MIFAEPGFSNCIIELFDIKNSNVRNYHPATFDQEEQSAILKFKEIIERNQAQKVKKELTLQVFFINELEVSNLAIVIVIV